MSRACVGRCVDLYVCTMLGWLRSTLCMASSAPFIVDEGVMSPFSASGATSALAAMWMICARAAQGSARVPRCMPLVFQYRRY